MSEELSGLNDWVIRTVDQLPPDVRRRNAGRIAEMTRGIYGPANPQIPPEASAPFRCTRAISRSFVFPGLVGEVALESHLFDLRPLLLRPLHVTFFHFQNLGQ